MIGKEKNNNLSVEEWAIDNFGKYLYLHFFNPYSEQFWKIKTSELSPTVQSRADKLSINYVFLGEHHKLKRVKYLCKILEIELSNIAFIGDEINDLELLQHVGLSACPSDAADYVKNEVKKGANKKN